MKKIVRGILDDFFSLCYNNKNAVKDFTNLYLYAEA